ncbi:hypothetical protein EIP91_003927 [Steccherinum ochraceum]|uniref:Uncharacterized protein n=1 Tax=Steccherinum ochraceum TaxID=92696 RepID=A0A4R0S027_9APHY|nr:hypothetical protein EIP91_003927 [Steccherinum ochraceum]
MRFTVAVATIVAFASTAALAAPFSNNAARNVERRVYARGGDLSSLTMRDFIEILNARDMEWDRLERRTGGNPAGAAGAAGHSAPAPAQSQPFGAPAGPSNPFNRPPAQAAPAAQEGPAERIKLAPIQSPNGWKDPSQLGPLEGTHHNLPLAETDRLSAEHGI